MSSQETNEFRQTTRNKANKSITTYVKNTVQNFSSYQLTTEEYTALSNGLDHHIPCKFNSNRIQNKFEQFYQSISKDISHILEDIMLENKASKHLRKIQ